jgi:hypothetical protein
MFFQQDLDFQNDLLTQTNQLPFLPLPEILVQLTIRFAAESKSFPVSVSTTAGAVGKLE